MGSAIFGLLAATGKYNVWGCVSEDDANIKLKDADIFVIAVKPQNFKDLAEGITAKLEDKIALSIMAGVTIENLKRALKMRKVVRTLPNLALKIGQSMTEWKCSEEVVAEEKTDVKNILQLFGKEIEVDNEGDINAMGIISGCGPAFFAYMAEIVAKAGSENGIDEKVANSIALQTLIGAAKYLEAENLEAIELREKVTSKGGITHAAVAHLQKNKFTEIFKEAFDKAIARSRELNG